MRRTGAEDRRQVLLILTHKGEKLLARLSTAHRDELRRLSPLLQTLLKHFKRKGVRMKPHILKTPNFVSGTGALRAALKAKANTRRVSDGAMMPSSQSRAVAK